MNFFNRAVLLLSMLCLFGCAQNPHTPSVASPLKQEQAKAVNKESLEQALFPPVMVNYKAGAEPISFINLVGMTGGNSSIESRYRLIREIGLRITPQMTATLLARNVSDYVHSDFARVASSVNTEKNPFAKKEAEEKFDKLHSQFFRNVKPSKYFGYWSRVKFKSYDMQRSVYTVELPNSRGSNNFSLSRDFSLTVSNIPSEVTFSVSVPLAKHVEERFAAAGGRRDALVFFVVEINDTIQVPGVLGAKLVSLNFYTAGRFEEPPASPLLTHSEVIPDMKPVIQGSSEVPESSKSSTTGNQLAVAQPTLDKPSQQPRQQNSGLSSEVIKQWNGVSGPAAADIFNWATKTPWECWRPDRQQTVSCPFAEAIDSVKTFASAAENPDFVYLFATATPGGGNGEEARHAVFKRQADGRYMFQFWVTGVFGRPSKILFDLRNVQLGLSVVSDTLKPNDGRCCPTGKTVWQVNPRTGVATFVSGNRI
jgi:hypothetical protein